MQQPLLRILRREFIYLWYYFELQARQIFWYWVIGMAIGSLVSVFAKDRIHGLFCGMQKKKWGRIVAIGSVQERKPHPQMLVYSSSKCAQTGLVQSLAVQLAKDGITVNTVAPGVIYTDRNIEALSNPEYAKQVTDSIPAGFYGQKEDIAGTVRLLCSDFGRYITGQNIFIDGGKSL